MSKIFIHWLLKNWDFIGNWKLVIGNSDALRRFVSLDPNGNIGIR